MITTHVLDTGHGKPAVGIPVHLELQSFGEEWKEVGNGVTDADGRLPALVPPGANLVAGVYRLIFDVETYNSGFYPRIVVEFRVNDPSEHYHVPLLLGPFGYTTYRGS